MEKELAVLAGIHPDLLETRANLLSDFFRRIGLGDAAIASQQIKDQQVGDHNAVGETSSLDPGEAARGEPATDLIENAGLADARLADDADGPSMPVFGLIDKAFQSRYLVDPVDEAGGSLGHHPVASGAPARNIEQAVGRDRLGFAF